MGCGDGLPLAAGPAIQFRYASGHEPRHNVRHAALAQLPDAMLLHLGNRKVGIDKHPVFVAVGTKFATQCSIEVGAATVLILAQRHAATLTFSAH